MAEKLGKLICENTKNHKLVPKGAQKLPNLGMVGVRIPKSGTDRIAYTTGAIVSHRIVACVNKIDD